MKMRTGRGITVAVLLLSCTSSCKKNPIDAALDTALDFSGFFRASDGTEIELDGSNATILTVGSTPLGATLHAGDSYMVGMAPTGTPGEYRGYVIGRTGMLDWGTARIGEGTLAIERATVDEFTGQSSWTRIDPPTPSQPSGGGGGDPSSSGTTTLLYKKDLEGKEQSSTYFMVTVPSGTKKLVVQTFEEDEWGHNLGDLFVSRGQKPVVTDYWSYTYTAQCASIEPNRDPETCTFDNPQAGDWYILLYGYHDYYGTSLKVTITK